MIHSCLYVSSSGGRRTFLRIALPSILLQFYDIGVFALTKDGYFAQSPLSIRFGAKHIWNPFDCVSSAQCRPFLLLVGFGILGKVNSSISSLSEFLHDNVLRVDRIRRIGDILKTIADQLQIRIFGTKPYRHQRYPIALCAEGWSGNSIICASSGSHITCLPRHSPIHSYTLQFFQSEGTLSNCSDLQKQTRTYGQQLPSFPSVINDLYETALMALLTFLLWSVSRSLLIRLWTWTIGVRTVSLRVQMPSEETTPPRFSRSLPMFRWRTLQLPWQELLLLVYREWYFQPASFDTSRFELRSLLFPMRQRLMSSDVYFRTSCSQRDMPSNDD